MSGPTMHPLTDLRLRAPVQRERKQEGLSERRRTRCRRTSCFVGKPCISLPPVMWKMELSTRRQGSRRRLLRSGCKSGLDGFGLKWTGGLLQKAFSFIEFEELFGPLLRGLW